MRDHGPVLRVRVGLSEVAELAFRRIGRPFPGPLELRAMVDTGSGRSVLKRGVPHRLGLTPVGEVEIDTPSSVDVPALEYFVRFWFDGLPAVEEKVMEAPLPVPGLEALIGRDILADAKFGYDGRRGEFSLEL